MLSGLRPLKLLRHAEQRSQNRNKRAVRLKGHLTDVQRMPDKRGLSAATPAHLLAIDQTIRSWKNRWEFCPTSTQVAGFCMRLERTKPGMIV
jgi:hypothetical protein